jgi:hypothetical protein
MYVTTHWSMLKRNKGLGPILVKDTKIVELEEPVRTITAQCLKEMGIVPPILELNSPRVVTCTLQPIEVLKTKG